MTIEQVERVKASCYGRYHEDTNSYDELCEVTEYEKCDICCDYFESEEIQRIEGLNYCLDCKKF